MTATKRGAPTNSPVFTGDPNAPTPDGTNPQSITTVAYVEAENIRGVTLGKGGSILTTDTNAADFPVAIPFACTLLRMRVTCKVAPTGAMAVQLRSAAGPITTAPTYTNIAGFAVTFVSGHVYADTGSTDPTPVAVNAGDMLNFTCTVGSGSNILIEVVTQI